MQGRAGQIRGITAKGSEGSGIEDLKAFAKALNCDRLGGPVVATLNTFAAEAAKRAAALPNSPELVRSAQTDWFGSDASAARPTER